MKNHNCRKLVFIKPEVVVTKLSSFVPGVEGDLCNIDIIFYSHFLPDNYIIFVVQEKIVALDIFVLCFSAMSCL